MKLLSRLSLTIAAIFITLIFGASIIKAQDRAPKCPNLDPVCVAPEHYKVLYEDDDVRVLRFQDTPGYAGPVHKHAHPYQVYSSTDSQRQFFKPDCTTKDGLAKQLVANRLLPVSNPVPVSKPVIHCETNSGTTNASLLIVEYKRNPPLPPAAPATVPAQRSVKSSRPARR